MKKEKLVTCRAFFGTDPELFIVSGGTRVIGCEKILKKGEKIQGLSYPGTVHAINDGVQMELNVSPQGCRSNLQTYLNDGLKAIKSRLEGINSKHKADLSISLAPSIIDVGDEEWETLTEDSKLLGCMPSLNVYDKDARIPEGANESRMRSAGGHLHLTLGQGEFKPQLIHLMDLIIGNTCVLLDREERAAERRQVYGRAGEYRLPAHGVEYRTLSNFWLAHPLLLHFVFGLLKMSYTIWHDSTWMGIYDAQYPGQPPVQKRVRNPDLLPSLMEKVTPEKVRDAINLNSLDLARDNFEILKTWIIDNVGTTRDCGGVDQSHLPPLRPDNLKAFEKFLQAPKLPQDGWGDRPTQGIDRFLSDIR